MTKPFLMTETSHHCAPGWTHPSRAGHLPRPIATTLLLTISSAEIVPGVSRHLRHFFPFRKTASALRTVSSGTGAIRSGHHNLDFFSFSSPTILPTRTRLRTCYLQGQGQAGAIMTSQSQHLHKALPWPGIQPCARSMLSFCSSSIAPSDDLL
jgi:hypothetical protein